MPMDLFEKKYSLFSPFGYDCGVYICLFENEFMKMSKRNGSIAKS